jgi:hypothetical protein
LMVICPLDLFRCQLSCPIPIVIHLPAN